MARQIPEASENALLGALPPQAILALSERLFTKPVSAGEILCEPGMPIIHLVFPHDSIVSLQTVLQDGRSVENASIGRDGMVGFGYFLGDTRSTTHATVAVSGRASWLAVSDFQDVLGSSDAARIVLRNYARQFTANLAQSVVCASVHSASQRVATWLLRAGDRTHGNRFDLTQRTMAGIFGLRLATISEACAKLHAAGAITQGRGLLSISDPDALKHLACECYDRSLEESAEATAAAESIRRPAYSNLIG